jgi:hypothetical protein
VYETWSVVLDGDFSGNISFWSWVGIHELRVLDGFAVVLEIGKK